MDILYECGICSCWHPWEWNGDCREDANRYADPEDYAERLHLSRLEFNDIHLRSMDDRIEADRA